MVRLLIFFLICRKKMKCLLCSLQFIRESVLKNHYANYHSIDEDDIFFKDLFLPDTVDKTCRICRKTFKNRRSKKKHMFFFIMKSGRRPELSTFSLNVLKRGSITYYSINFEQHKNFYDFFNSSMVDAFLGSVYEIFRPSTEKKIQGYAEIVNQ